MTFNNIVILLTPFHKIAIEKCFPNLIDKADTLVLHSELISPHSKENLVHIPNLNAKDFLRKPFTTYSIVKKYFKYCSNISKEFIASCATNNIKLVLGTEKDTFTQVFLNELYKSCKTVELIFVDEGIGYYKKAPKISLRGIYSILTPVLFCQKIQRVDVLGTDKRANKVFCRFPEYIEKQPNVEYVFFSLNNKAAYKQEREALIIFTVPSQDINISSEKARELITAILKSKLFINKPVFIKPHPRDTSNYLQLSQNWTNLHFIEKHLPAEELNFNEFSSVIHFGSSIILYLYERKFPQKKIYSFLPKGLDNTLFKDTNCMKFTTNTKTITKGLNNYE